MRRITTTLILLSSLAALALAPLQSAQGKQQEGIVLAPKNETENRGAELMMQGSVLLKQKQPFKARPLLEQAVQLWPTLPHGWFNLGLCYSEAGEFAKAIDAYKQAIKLDHSLTEVLPNIGSCYQMMGQSSQAIPWFEEYLRKCPKAADAPQVLGMINALKHAEGKQIVSDPQAFDYLTSVCPEGHMQRWPRTTIPLKVFISAGSDEAGRPVNGFREYYNELLVDSIDAWMRASGGRLSYQVVENVRDANIVCTWTDRPDFLKDSGNAVEQGAAQITARPINDHEDEIGHCRVIVLIKDMQKGTNIPDDVLKMTCLHEFGHALGLAGHSTNNRDVMFFSEAPSVWAALTKRDKATMARLYSDYPIQFAQTPSQAQYPPNQQVPMGYPAQY